MSPSADVRHEAFLHREKTISVCLPAVNEERTIGQALGPLMKMRQDGYVDQVVVVDESDDWTADIAQSLGADVYRQSDLKPELGRVLGKGDAMWRALAVLSGDVILFLDADSTSIQRHYVFAMCAPLLAGEAQLVKGHYCRPLGSDPNGGGRVNHLLARPLLRRHFPALDWIEQPLAGETAIDRTLAGSLPFVCGYGVEMGLLIDAHTAGASIAQADLHLHDHRHRPLAELSEMADEIMAVTLQRAGYAVERPPERPPVAAPLTV